MEINDPTARETYQTVARSVKLQYGKILNQYEAEECVLDVTRAIVWAQEYDAKVRRKIECHLTQPTDPYTDLSSLPIPINVWIAAFEDLYLARLAKALALFKLDVTQSDRFVTSVRYAYLELQHHKNGLRHETQT